MRKLCFVCNFDKTPVFMALADILQKKGVEIFWIVQKDSQHKALLKEYPPEKILLINRDCAKLNNEPVGSFKLNEIIYGDRVLREERKDYAYKFLTNIQQPIYNFIKVNKIGILFGEATQSYELLMSRMCRNLPELNCQYLTTMVTRIPDKRLFFFKDEKLSEVLELTKPVECKDIIDDFEVKAPYYLAENDKMLADRMSLIGVLTRLYNFVSGRHIEKNDPGVIVNRWRHFKVVSKEIFNQYTYKFLKTRKEDSLKDKEFVLFGFHVQPEASIDVCGRYYEDQYKNVVNIWRNLPDDWYLVIKEHSNGIGNRSYKYLHSLSKLRHVIILDEHTSALDLMKKSKAVISVTGTMAIEAAMQGIPAITLAPMWFNLLNYCNHMGWEEMEKIDLKTYTESVKEQTLNKDEYMEFVLKNSFEGEFDGILSNPRVMEKDNLNKLSQAFLTVL